MMVVSGQKTREGDCTNLWCSQRRLEKCLKQRDSKSTYFIGYNRAKYKNIRNAQKWANQHTDNPHMAIGRSAVDLRGVGSCGRRTYLLLILIRTLTQGLPKWLPQPPHMLIVFHFRAVCVHLLLLCLRVISPSRRVE